MNTKVARSLGIAALCPALFWLGGFNFDARGEIAAACAILTIFAFAFALAAQTVRL